MNMLKSDIVKVAGLVSGLVLGGFGALGLAGTAQAAPSGGGTCVVGTIYHTNTTYSVPDCNCPSRSIKQRRNNGDYWCSYPERQGPLTPAQRLPRVAVPR